MYKYNSLQINVIIPHLESILYDNIKDEDLYINHDKSIDGLELESHVTLLHGIEPEYDFEYVQEHVDLPDISELLLTIPAFGIFESKEYDVLYFEIQCDMLNVLHYQLKNNIPNTYEFDQYKPHLTLAYLKPGLGRKYLNHFGEIKTPLTLFPDDYLFSYANLNTNNE